MNEFSKRVYRKFGDEEFTLKNTATQEKYEAVKYTKSSQNCIFNHELVNDSNTDDINSLFDFADTNKDGNLTFKEMANAIYNIVDVGAEDGSEQLDLSKMMAFLQNNGVNLKNVQSILSFIKLSNIEVDRTTYVYSGIFETDGTSQYLQAEKFLPNEKNRTYRLTNPKDGKSNIATFGGQNPKTQQMVSEFYARIFDNPGLIAKPIVYKDMDDLQGVINPNVNPQTLDKAKKLGLDIFFSNDEQFEYMSYAGTLDETSRSHNTIFSIVPTEFNTLLEKSNYTKEDIIQAIETILSISDDEIKEILTKYGNNERFEDILLKRKAFLSKMLEQIKLTEQNENETIKDYVQKIQVQIIISSIDSIENQADLNSYLKVTNFIQDENIRNSITEKINNQKAKLADNIEQSELNSITPKQIKNLIKKYGGTKAIQKDIQDIYQNYDDIDNIKPGMMTFLSTVYNEEELSKKYNNLRKLGIDITKDKESFIKFILYTAIARRWDYNVDSVAKYKLITDTIYTSLPDKQEQKAIDYYKSMAYANIHRATDGLLLNDDEPNQIKEYIETLNNYLHKHKTTEDVEIYRGEISSRFSNITMPNGKNLGDELYAISRQLEKLDKEKQGDGEIPKELRNRIEEIINYVNNNTIDVTNTQFCSTSVNRSIGNGYHEVTLEINLPAGSSAVFIDAFNFSGKNAGETEVLTSFGATEHITGAYFDEKARRIVFKTTLLTDT